MDDIKRKRVTGDTATGISIKQTKLVLEPERCGVEVAPFQPMMIANWPKPLDDRKFEPLRRISEPSDLVIAPFKRMSLSKKVDKRFSNDDGVSISAIAQDAGHESSFGPFLDSEVNKISVFDIHKLEETGV